MEKQARDAMRQLKLYKEAATTQYSEQAIE
jgi:hypothetical protein